MKKFFKWVGILALIVVIAMAAAIFFTSDLPTVADNFFKEIKNNNYTAAEKYLSENFKQTTPIGVLKRAFPYERFKNYSGYSFATREKNADGTASLKGKIKFSDGSVMPIKIELVKENDRWKIDHITLPKAGISTTVKTKTQNPKKLVETTMIMLIKAIETNNYSDIYNASSYEFKKSVSKQRLSKAFSPLKKAVSLRKIKKLTPVIEEKTVSDKGVLKITGHYPTSPNILNFEFEYIKNNGEWKIFGLFLKFTRNKG